MADRHVFDDDLSCTLTEDEILEVQNGTPERADELLNKASARASERAREEPTTGDI